jgi:aerobic-type carbon monoxide dehydrogenase small subunit (CoxS/CutS family)
MTEQEALELEMIYNDGLSGLFELEMATKFGQDTGECGMCGDPLDGTQREAGLCFDHQLDLESYETGE